MDATHPDFPAPLPPATSDPLQELSSLGEYRILRLLGEGGMGSVYLGYHEGRGQQVALKVLADNLVSNRGYIERFYREARSAALLNHPHIVRGFAVGQDTTTGKHYLVLEYVDGPSAQALLEQYGRLPVGDCVRLAVDIARALEHAHSRNIVHRDIKPDNILISQAGIAKLADLGLAKRIDELSHLTGQRQAFGTSYYMPYEQAMSAKSVDGRSDIYALGATLYHLLTGEVPFPGDNHLEVIDKKERGEYTPASAVCAEATPELDRILSRMLARQPRDRYQTAAELLYDLQRSGLAAATYSFLDSPPSVPGGKPAAGWVSDNEPTKPELEAPTWEERDNPKPPQSVSPVPGKRSGEIVPSVATEMWFLRLRDEAGRLRLVKATTYQIVLRLDKGHIPATTLASRQADGQFQPLYEYAEFRSATGNGRKQVKSGRKAASTGTAHPVRWLLAGALLGLGIAAGVLAAYWFFSS